MTDHELSCYIVGRQNALSETGRHNQIYKLAESSSQGYSKLLLGYTINSFAAELYDKALKAREKYGFNELGWAYPDWEQELQKGITEHLQKGDPRDVAIYALFAWFHGWSTATPKHTEDQKVRALHDACVAERWPTEHLQNTAEGGLAKACFEAGYKMGSLNPLPLIAPTT